MTKQPFVQRPKDGRKYLRYKAAPSVTLPAGIPEDSAAFLAVYKPALKAAMQWLAARETKGHRAKALERKKDRTEAAFAGSLDAVIHDFYQTAKYKKSPAN